MDFEDLILKYRSFSLIKRFSLWVILVVSYNSYEYYDKVIIINENKDKEEALNNQLMGKLDKAIVKKQNLPGLIKSLEEIKANLEKASKKLPDEFNVDNILKDLSDIAEKTKVRILFFDPQKTSVSDTAFKFIQMPIKIQVLGDFVNIANFFDEILHLEVMIRINNYDLKNQEPKLDEQKSVMSEEDREKYKRKFSKVLANIRISIFRSLTEEENQKVLVEEKIQADREKAKSRVKK